ncbi:N-methylglutamate synthase subunit A [Enteractinococcus coprophilus]|uniref:glutamine--fructose-6-phosphate transaminase (isomerizing) n=2 Tax=Enteractinococcus coprophilus TaxID=1027633 RepID=A0A543AMH2_9MICC|nr:N-methylglutamate synthase subunit A [Enteractinococcus coprophilus]
MCGIAGIQLRDEKLIPQLGSLMHEMVDGIVVRGPDSAGVAIYGDRELLPEEYSSVSLLDAPGDTRQRVAERLSHDADVSVENMSDTTFIRAKMPSDQLVALVREIVPEASVIGAGDDSVIYKGVGNPMDLRETYRLSDVTGWQGVLHTRLATESAVSAAGAHPYSVNGLSVVHNGSFANHATIRRDLEEKGLTFDSENDTEVASRYISYRMQQLGEDLQTAVEALSEEFDGFYTLLVTTEDSFAVVRDQYACKPAIIAEHPDWVAMASEFQAIAHLPGMEDAEIFEPGPGKVYTWKR